MLKREDLDLQDYGIFFKTQRSVSLVNSVDPIITKCCNLRCPHCWGSNSTNEYLSIGNFEKILSLASYLNIKEIQFTGGEPLLHKDVFNFARISKDNYFDNRLRTNLCLKLFSDIEILKILEMFNSIYVSIDGCCEVNFALRPSIEYAESKSRNGSVFKKLARENFDIIEQNLNKLLNFKSRYNYKNKIIISTVVQNYNIDNMQELAEFLNSYDVRWDISQVILDRSNKRYIDDKIFLSKIKNILQHSNNIVKIKPISCARCLRADNSGNILLSDHNDIMIGNYFDTNLDNYALILKHIDNINNNYVNYFIYRTINL